MLTAWLKCIRALYLARQYRSYAWREAGTWWLRAALLPTKWRRESAEQWQRAASATIPWSTGGSR